MNVKKTTYGDGTILRGRDNRIFVIRKAETSSYLRTCKFCVFSRISNINFDDLTSCDDRRKYYLSNNKDLQDLCEIDCNCYFEELKGL